MGGDPDGALSLNSPKLDGAAHPLGTRRADAFITAPWNMSPLLATAVLLLSSIYKDGPPPGPTDQAFCPVTGEAIKITADTPAVAFKNGQQLYFHTADAATAYRYAPRNYWLAPTDMPLAAPDGMRGLPDLRGQTLLCPQSGENITVAMQSIRVDHKNGQAVYFCCHGCVMSFWTDPASMFA